MIIVLAKATAKKDMKNNIIEESKKLIKSTRLEEGCIEYNLYTPLDEDNALLFVENWESKNHLESHLKQDHFINFGSSIKDYLEKELEISIYSSEEIEL